MSHQIAEEKKRIGSKLYELQISYSGGVTYASIIVWEKQSGETSMTGKTYAEEEGRGAEQKIMSIWKRLS